MDKERFLGALKISSEIKQPLLNTQYMTNSTLVYPVKMEYVSKINIFGLKMLVKNGLKKPILKFFHAQFFLLKSLHAQTRSILLMIL